MGLQKIFGKTPRLRILEFFLCHPSSSFSLTEIAKKIGVSIGSVFRHCRDLEKERIISLEVKGKSRYYSLNRENRTVTHLKKFYNLTSPPIVGLIHLIPSYAIKKAILFGSYARGEDDEDSDVDILLIGDIKSSETLLLASKMSKFCKKKFSLIAKTYEEYLSAAGKDEPFWKKVAFEGVVIYGI